MHQLYNREMEYERDSQKGDTATNPLRFFSSGFAKEYTKLSNLGAFSENSSEMIFEDENKKYILAAL